MYTPSRLSLYVPALNIGGAQRVSVALANGFVRAGIETDLLLSVDEGPLGRELDPDVRVVELGGARPPIVGVGSSVPSLAEYLSRTEPSALFSSMAYASLVTVCAAALARSETRIVGIQHSKYGSRPSVRDTLVDVMMRFGYGRMDAVVAVTESVAESVRSATVIDDGRVHVINNPVQVDQIREAACSSPPHEWLADDLEVVLSVGRFDSRKDYPTLLGAFDRLREARPDVRLILVGDGPEAESIRRDIRDRNIEEVVCLPGYEENPYPYMAHADVFALSSVTEGLPTVLVEALACGCPVVSTDCSTGPREILGEEARGRIVPVGDERQLARALDSVLSERDDPERLREIATAFAPEKAIDAYLSLVEELVRPPPDSASDG